MPAALGSSSTSGTLRFAVVLAAVAGFLDAHIFQQVTPVFVANHSGNLIKLGMDVGDGRLDEAAISLGAIVAFALGVGGATLFLQRAGPEPPRGHVATVLAGEVVLLVAVFVLIGALDLHRTFDPGWEQYLVVAIGATAMGLQTAALGRVGATAVSTTFGSGSVARIGEHTALGTFRSDGAERHGHLRAARVLLAVVISYVAGGALASALSGRTMAVVLPVAAVGLLAAIDGIEQRRSA